MEPSEDRFTSMRLKKVLKESHGTSISHMTYGRGIHENLLAVVGGDQITLYDDARFGYHLDVVAQFVHTSNEYVQGGKLNCCCFLGTTIRDAEKHPFGDVRLAVGGESGVILIISLVECKVTNLLEKHSKGIVTLEPDPSSSGELLSLGKDGLVCHWDADSGVLLRTIQTKDATCIAIEPSNLGGVTAFVSGHKNGKLKRWSIMEEGTRVETKQSRPPDNLPMLKHVDAVDFIAFIPGGRLATKSVDGKIIIWDYKNKEFNCSWQTSMVGMGKFSCRPGVTSDGRFIATGTGDGHVQVHCAYTGRKVATLSPVRLTAPVTCCVISKDYKHILASLGQGFIFRFEHREVAQVAKEQGS